MIKNASEMIAEVKESLRDGKGTVEIMHIVNQEEMTGKCRLFAKLTINPGCSIGMHPHIDEEEIYYIIKGKGIVNDNGNIKEITVGDSVLTGGGASHSIENNGEEPLELVAAVLLF